MALVAEARRVASSVYWVSFREGLLLEPETSGSVASMSGLECPILDWMESDQLVEGLVVCMCVWTRYQTKLSTTSKLASNISNLSLHYTQISRVYVGTYM